MATPEPRPWAGPDGLPTRHVSRAALHVAALLDERGSRVVDARESYWRRATGGTFPPPDLALGERLLIDCGLVDAVDGMLYPRPALETLLDGTLDDGVTTLTLLGLDHSLANGLPLADQEILAAAAQVPDAERREQLLLALGQRFDDAHRRLLGEIGEELVVAEARAELTSLGYPELARAVRRVSLESDALGYDVSAPRVGTGPRLLEVKATTGEAIAIHLSRNEAETGARFDAWALVVCQIADVDQRAGEIAGWCPGSALAHLLPVDVVGGRWEQAFLTLDGAMLFAGLPRATA
jgi:hypothetical protein